MIAAGRPSTMPPMLVDAESAQAAMRFATPVLVAAVGELVVERAGVVNIGIEGMMLAGALAAWVANGYGGPAAGFLGGGWAGRGWRGRICRRCGCSSSRRT